MNSPERWKMADASTARRPPAAPPTRAPLRPLPPPSLPGRGPRGPPRPAPGAGRGAPAVPRSPAPPAPGGRSGRLGAATAARPSCGSFAPENHPKLTFLPHQTHPRCQKNHPKFSPPPFLHPPLSKGAACLLTPCVRCLSEPPPRAAAAMEPACVSPHAPHTRHGPTATDPRAACCVAVYIKNK